MTLQAVSHRRRVNGPLYIGGILVGMAGQTKSIRSRRDQHDPSDIFVHPDLMTAHAAHCNRGMHRFALRLVLVTLEALGPVGIFIQRHRVYRSRAARNENSE